MKDFVIRVAFLVVILLIVPLVLTKLFCSQKQVENKDVIISVYDAQTSGVFDMKLDEYIVNVVAAEMPASFSREALKAQAICARTYALRKVNGDDPKHKGADVCTDFAHCQAYLTNDALKEKWGKDYNGNFEKISSCVLQTSGKVLTYNGELAISVFHSCSNGKTENAKDVWGGDYPYLVSVDSVGDFENRDYSSVVTVSKKEFAEKINTLSQFKLAPDNLSISGFKMTEGNNVESVMIGDCTFSGTEIRKLFSLKSSSFTVDEKNDNFVFTVYGNGHGVGMSQYGANAMAEKGDNCESILKHYYQGVTIEDLNKLP